MAAPTARYARPDEAAAIVEIICDAFEPWVIERTIYGCGGAVGYVEATIRQAPAATPAFLVVADSNDVLGAAEVAVDARDLFLSYISTRPDERSRGLGTALLRAAVGHGERWQARTMTLDVFEDNLRARAWYAGLGFAPAGQRSWWETELPEAPDATVPVAGLAQAQVCHDAFGFSEISVISDGESYRIVQLGTGWFRVTNLAVLRAPRVLATLRSLDPSRALLMLGAADDVDGRSVGLPALRSIRLQASLAALGQRLASGVEI